MITIGKVVKQLQVMSLNHALALK